MASNSSATASASGGVGFFGLLTLIFITLKLCGVIAWSWWLVLAPLWISLLVATCIVVGIIGVVVFVGILAAFVKKN